MSSGEGSLRLPGRPGQGGIDGEGTEWIPRRMWGGISEGRRGGYPWLRKVKEIIRSWKRPQRQGAI